MALTVDQMRQWSMANKNASDAERFQWMQANGITPEMLAPAAGVGLDEIRRRYNIQLQNSQSAGLPAISTPAPIEGEYIQASSSYSPNFGFSDGYGLSGAESAIQGGALGGLDILKFAANKVGDAYGAGIEGLAPYMSAGASANDRLSNLTGLNGVDAQTAALDSYQESPWVSLVRENAERGIARNAAATGNLGSGNTLDQLYQNSAGLFLNDFYNQLGVTGDIANRGLSASGTAGGLYSGLGNAYAGLGSQAATIPVNAGNTTGAYRYQAGRDMSSNIGSAAAGSAQYVNQQGAGISDIVGNTTNNINSILQSAYGGDATAKQNLMSLLTGLATQTGGQVGSLPIIPGAQTNYLGQFGQVASGLGGLAQGLSAFNNPANNASSTNYYDNTSPVNVSGYV